MAEQNKQRNRTMTTPTILFRRTIPGAIIPIRATEHSCGFDVFCPTDVHIYAGRNLVDIGIAAAIPDGCFGWITSRSGYAAKGFAGVLSANDPQPEIRFDADVIDGKIDSDYRGSIRVIVNNLDTPFIIRAGQRIAQLVIMPYLACNWQEVDNLDNTERGEGGFNSTGV